MTGELKSAVDQFYKALNIMFTGDVGPMLDIWSHADDVTYMGPVGGFQVGWDEIKPLWVEQANNKLGGEVVPTEMVFTIGETLALTHNYEKGKNINSEGKVEEVSIRVTNIFRKENGKWKMVGHHTDLLPFLMK